MIIVDKKCIECGKIIEDAFLDETDVCCEKEMKRIFGYRKYGEFVPGLYSHFGHEDIYLTSVEDYRKACKKHNVEQMGGKGKG